MPGSFDRRVALAPDVCGPAEKQDKDAFTARYSSIPTAASLIPARSAALQRDSGRRAVGGSGASSGEVAAGCGESR